MRRKTRISKLLQTALAAAAAAIVSHGTAQAQTCGVALDKAAMIVGANEANWSVNVTAPAACAWTATSDSDWLIVKSTMPAIAAGNGYAKVRAVTNTTSPAKRTGHFFVNGVVYTVTQSGCGTSCTSTPPPAPAPVCTFTLDKTAMTVGVGEANWNITVTTQPTCAWSATSDSDWLIVRSTTPAPAAGNGSARIRAVTNTISPSRRVGHVTIGGAVYTVTQGGCGTSCAPANQPADEPPPPPPSQPVTPNVPVNPGTLRILQYNTHHGGWGTDGVYSPDRIVAQIVKAKPDVVCMNEIEQFDSWSKNLDQTVVYQTLLQNATGKTWYKVFMNHAGATTGNGNLILSTFPFIATASYLLPASRSAVDATIDVNGRVVNIISTHMDNVSATNRKNEITALLPWAVTFAEARVILGDYNAWPETTEISMMKANYIDTWTAAQAMHTAIGSGITHGVHRIDYIFLSKTASFLQLASVESFNTADANGVKPSDHDPVLAVFDVR
jgi:endonuclease/exonuclease/phosphatase family metal-dependent hydrolase